MAQVLSGSRAVFKLAALDGQATKIGYAYGVDVDQEITHEEVQTLDALSVSEHVPVAYRVSMSAEIFKTIPSVAAIAESVKTPALALNGSDGGKAASLQKSGFMPNMGKSDIAALQQQPLTATLFDNGPGGGIIGQVSGCRIASARFSLRARQIVAENVRFVCQRFTEGELSA